MKINSDDIKRDKDPFHYRYRNFFVGFFVLIAFFIIAAFIFYTITKGELMENKATLVTHFKPGEGLQEGSVVKIHGKTVGYVKAVILKINGYSEVKFTVRQDYLHLIRKDSIARLKQKNIFFGDWEIDISIGSESIRLVKDGDTLKGETPFNLSNTFKKFNNIVDSLTILTERVERGEGLLGQLFSKDGIEDIEKKLEEKMRPLLKDLDRTSNNAQLMLERLTTFGETGIKTMDAFLIISQKTDLLIKKTDTMVNDLEQLIKKMDVIPEDTQNLIKNLKNTLKETDILLEGIQNHWLFRRAVRKVRKKITKEKMQGQG